MVCCPKAHGCYSEPANPDYSHQYAKRMSFPVAKLIFQVRNHLPDFGKCRKPATETNLQMWQRLCLADYS
jgi:hypothetical protein